LPKLGNLAVDALLLRLEAFDRGEFPGI